MSTKSDQAHGGICCTDRYTCCDNCKAKLAAEKTARNLASRLSDYEPPDSYKAALDKRRRESGEPPPAQPTVPTGYDPPDSYAAGLAKLRRENKIQEPHTPTRTPRGYEPPDPYAAGLAKLRREQRS